MRRIIPIIRQWWYRNHPSKDEFAQCYSLDVDYLMDIREKAIYYQALADKWYNMEKWYHHDLCERRDDAHEEDMKK
jgi:hypothetical protein